MLDKASAVRELTWTNTELTWTKTEIFWDLYRYHGFRPTSGIMPVVGSMENGLYAPYYALLRVFYNSLHEDIQKHF